MRGLGVLVRVCLQERELMTKYRLWPLLGLGLTGLVLVLALLALVTYQEHLAGERLEAHSQATPALLQSTVIMTLGSTWLGRAYLDRPSQLLWTNFHVLRPYCRQAAGELLCDLPQVWMTQHGRAQSQSVRLDLIRCSSWIDGCVFAVDGKGQTRIFFEQFAGRWAPFYSLHTLPLPMDAPPRNHDFLQGRAVEDNPTLFFSSLPSRPGLSGSPVYDEAGEFRGLIRASVSATGFNLHRLFARLGANSFQWFRERTHIVGAPVLARVLLCPSLEGESCADTSRRELESYLEQVVTTGGGKGIFYLGRGSYVAELVETLFRFADDEPAIVEELLRAEPNRDCPSEENMIRRRTLEAWLRKTWNCRGETPNMPIDTWRHCSRRLVTEEWIDGALGIDRSWIWQASVRRQCRMRSGV
jgi:hypothetical protein